MTATLAPLEPKPLEPLTPRWYPLRPNAAQSKRWRATTRFTVTEAGRRSGKTELEKRDGVMAGLLAPAHIPDFRVAFCAPTRDQAKAIYWDDLKRFIPSWLVVGVWETELRVLIKNGCSYHVIGMDRPERLEGRPWDVVKCDEFAQWKPGSFDRHVRPALDTDGRPGKAALYGVPRPSLEFARYAERAQDPTEVDWSYHWWTSASVLPPEVIEQARKDLDELTFAQEYEAQRVNFAGRAYYAFDRRRHSSPNLQDRFYDPRASLIFCFDFNVEPGVAVVCQEYETPKAGRFTGVIGEVHIPRNSTTEAVCRRLVTTWGAHEGRVFCYGDATGGARGSAKVAGSDWDLIRRHLDRAFPGRTYYKVPKANPAERARVNAFNTRLLSADGVVAMRFDPHHAPATMVDAENVLLLEGGSGEIDKKADPSRTHWTDALGYYIVSEYPAGGLPEIKFHAR